MNRDYENKLEAAIDRELKSLPALQAPGSLMSRVMAAIEQRARLPWYRRSWQSWPLSLQAASFALLAAIFGGLCFGGASLDPAQNLGGVQHTLAGWFAPVASILHTVNVVLSSLAVAVKQLGSAFMIACVAALAIGYGLCVGLGTVWYRVGHSRPLVR